MEWAILIGIVIIQGLGHVWVSSIHAKRFQRIIDRQNDTIHRLITHQPVTYAEVGKEPQKRNKQVYAAWGAQMVDLDEDEHT